MKKFFRLNIEFDVLEFVKLIDPPAYHFVDNGDSNFILGWSLSESDIIEYGKSDHFFDQLEQKSDYLFGYFGYDLKNVFLPGASSENDDLHNFPESVFFKATDVIIKKNGEQLYFGDSVNFEQLKQKLTKSIRSQENVLDYNIKLISKTSKKEYLTNINGIKTNIQRGNSYELNYCTQFFKSDTVIDTISIYQKLRSKSKAPFSTLLSIKSINVLSASPERFINRTNDVLTSQPIKGTAKRSTDPKQDQKLKQELMNSEKEISENVMIVDLVRNDFSKIALKNSVIVKALCALYTFPTVHQLISTVQCNISNDITIEQILAATFPMGSMTGAPKIKSTELIDHFENFKRGIYSGAVGYLGPNKSFDFNVIIRSILYNSEAKNLSCSVGGAITIKSDAESEYEECLLKLNLLANILDQAE